MDNNTIPTPNPVPGNATQMQVEHNDTISPDHIKKQPSQVMLPLFILVLLAVIVGGVYVVLNKNEQASIMAKKQEVKKVETVVKPVITIIPSVTTAPINTVAEEVTTLDADLKEINESLKMTAPNLE